MQKLIEIDAKIRMVIPNPTEDDSMANTILFTEQELNKIGYITLPETKTKVGVRFHFFPDLMEDEIEENVKEIPQGENNGRKSDQ